MKKSELIEMMSMKTGLSKTDATRAMDALTEIISTALSTGERGFSLHNIGKFSVTKTKPRTARNPKTGEEIKIAAGERVKFTAAKALKEAVKRDRLG